MWTDMFVLQVPLLEKVLRVVVVYSLILILTRASGKRGMANMNALDFIVVFLLAGTVETALLGEDNTITGGAISAILLITLNWVVRLLIRVSPLMGRILEGLPTTVIEHGQIIQPAMRKLGLRNSELDHAIRSQNGDAIDEIELGELTPSGKLVLSLKPGEQSSTKDDIAALTERLCRIEDLLTTRADPPPPPATGV